MKLCNHVLPTSRSLWSIPLVPGLTVWGEGFHQPGSWKPASDRKWNRVRTLPSHVGSRMGVSAADLLTFLLMATLERRS